MDTTTVPGIGLKTRELLRKNDVHDKHSLLQLLMDKRNSIKRIREEDVKFSCALSKEGLRMCTQDPRGTDANTCRKGCTDNQMEDVDDILRFRKLFSAFVYFTTAPNDAELRNVEVFREISGEHSEYTPVNNAVYWRAGGIHYNHHINMEHLMLSGLRVKVVNTSVIKFVKIEGTHIKWSESLSSDLSKGFIVVVLEHKGAHDAVVNLIGQIKKLDSRLKVGIKRGSVVIMATTDDYEFVQSEFRKKQAIPSLQTMADSIFDIYEIEQLLENKYPVHDRTPHDLAVIQRSLTDNLSLQRKYHPTQRRILIATRRLITNPVLSAICHGFVDAVNVHFRPNRSGRRVQTCCWDVMHWAWRKLDSLKRSDSLQETDYRAAMCQCTDLYGLSVLAAVVATNKLSAKACSKRLGEKINHIFKQKYDVEPTKVLFTPSGMSAAYIAMNSLPMKTSLCLGIYYEVVAMLKTHSSNCTIPNTRAELDTFLKAQTKVDLVCIDLSWSDNIHLTSFFDYDITTVYEKLCFTSNGHVVVDATRNGFFSPRLDILEKLQQRCLKDGVQFTIVYSFQKLHSFGMDRFSGGCLISYGQCWSGIDHIYTSPTNSIAFWFILEYLSEQLKLYMSTIHLNGSKLYEMLQNSACRNRIVLYEGPQDKVNVQFRPTATPNDTHRARLMGCFHLGMRDILPYVAYRNSWGFKEYVFSVIDGEAYENIRFRLAAGVFDPGNIQEELCDMIQRCGIGVPS
jgi:hypothetical protein